MIAPPRPGSSGARPVPELRYPGRVLRVRFLSRPNRYLATVQGPDGRKFAAHVPNPGRLKELLPPGGTHGHVIEALPRVASTRKTRWTLVNVEYPPNPSTLVSVDTGAQARLVGSALAGDALPPLDAWGTWEREVTWGAHHRFDHAVLGERGRGQGRPLALLEVKSSNLKEGSQALFPDAPTLRGTSHVDALARFSRGGGRAALLFLVQRDDVRSVAPYGAMDPPFARAVTRAQRAGVLLLGWSLHVLPDGARWGDPLPVDLPRWEPAHDLEEGYRGGRPRPPRP